MNLVSVPPGPRQGKFSPISNCKPIQCGPAPKVQNATNSIGSGAVLTFPQKVHYECDPGHSTDGDSKGATSFDATCANKGAFEGMRKCQPIRCSGPCTGSSSAPACKENAFGPNAHYDQGEVARAKFGDRIEVTCAVGHALHKDTPAKNKYQVACKEHGRIERVDPGTQCTPVDCGVKPKVKHGKLTGGTRYGDILSGEADEGWSLDGTPHAKRFESSCN